MLIINTKKKALNLIHQIMIDQKVKFLFLVQKNSYVFTFHTIAFIHLEEEKTLSFFETLFMRVI